MKDDDKPVVVVKDDEVLDDGVVSKSETVDNSGVQDTDNAVKPKPTIGDHLLRTLNEGTLEELMAIHGIGEKKAQKIIAERNKLGPDGVPVPFTNISDVNKRVKGIGDALTNDLIALDKRKLVDTEPQSIDKQVFYDDLAALKALHPDVPEYELMKRVVKGEGPSGKKQMLQGDAIGLDQLKEAGAFTRTMSLEEVYKYLTKGSAKQMLEQDHGITSPLEFAKAISDGTLDFNPSWLDTGKPLSGDVGWWALMAESQAVNAFELEKDNAAVPDKYKYGALRFSVNPDMALTLGFKKPTALDGMFFEEWVPESSGNPLGVTAGGKKEVVAPPVALGKATGLELFTAGGKKDIAPPVTQTKLQQNE